MRPRRRGALAAIASVAIVAAVGGLAVAALRRGPPALLSAVEGTAAPGADGVPEIRLELRAGEYVPNVIHTRAGAPLRLRISRADVHGCADRLLVPDLGTAAELAPGGTTTVTVPAAAGEYLFTCGARMVKGVLLFE